MADAREEKDAKTAPEPPMAYFSINPRSNLYSSEILARFLQVLPREPPQESGRGWFAGSYQFLKDGKALGIVVTDAYSTGASFTGASRFAFLLGDKGVIEGPKEVPLDLLVRKLFPSAQTATDPKDAKILAEAEEEINRLRLREERRRHRFGSFGD